MPLPKKLAAKKSLITTADVAPSAGDPPTKAEYDLLAALANEVKATLNAMNA